MGMFSDICTALEGLRYTVHKEAKEKLIPGEVEVLLHNIDMDLDSFTLYEYNTVQISIRWTETDPDIITTNITKLVYNLDQAIHQPTFKFGKPDIKRLGQLYDVTVICEYKEIIHL